MSFPEVDGNGKPFKAELLSKSARPPAAADKGVAAKLELFGDINGVLSHVAPIGYVSTVTFSSPSGHC